MDPIPNYLSIWELAHRWHGAVPSFADESSVSRDIRDTLLALINAVLNSQVGLYDLVVAWMGEDTQEHSPRVYEMAVEKVPKEFEEMFSSGRLDRELLQAYCLSLESVFMWCVRAGYDVPGFCVPAWALAEPKVEAVTRIKARPEAEDKAKCQEIAVRKWAESPRTRIAEMARDRDIRVEGNGGLYTEPTVLSWLREVAPATVKGRPGRPRREGNDQE